LKGNRLNSMIAMFRNVLLLLATLCLAAPASGDGGYDLESVAQLNPGEEYRQLSLLMLVSGGVDPALVGMLQPLVEQQPPGAVASLDLDDYVTPLVRIVDQDVLLAHAAGMFAYARETGPAIQARMTEIAQAHPILISMIDVNELAADAIIIRNTIADSIEYAGALDHPEREVLLAAFRGETIHLRNMMEYNQFQEELAQITDRAIIDLGGRLDAYQRMFEEDVDPDLIRRRVESAEIMNRQTGNRYEDQALNRNAELLMMLILMESQVR